MQRLASFFRLTLILLLATWVVSATQPAASAAVNWVGKGYGTDNDSAKLEGTVSIFPHIENTNYGQIMALHCAIRPTFGPDECTNNRNIYMDLMQKSTLANIGSGIAFMYASPPADFGMWLADTGQTLGLIPKPAYAAAGVGFNGLAPLLGIWKAFRNISYLLLAIFMLVIGFMVMFRKKIDPKTVVTVQNSLPRVVVTLILITFSYAIVGLMIDLMYLVIALATTLLRQGFPSFSNLINNFTDGGFFSLFIGIFNPVKNMNPWGRLPEEVFSGQWGESITDLFSGLVFNMTGVGPLFQFLISLFYLFAFIRILFMLLGSYVQVLISVITAPVQILLDMFPGSEMFANWIKNLVANLAAFPITVFFLAFANIIGKSFNEGTLWVPPLLPQPVGGVGGAAGFATGLISIGIILVIPTAVGAVKEMMKAKAAPVGFEGGGGGLMQLVSLAYYAKMLAPQDWWGKIFPEAGGGGHPKK